MHLLTKEQAQQLDSLSQEKYGISARELMGNAGQQIAETVINLLADQHDPLIGVICGKGNNGGDGFAAAAVLKSKGFRLCLYYLNRESAITGTPRFYYQQCTEAGLKVESIVELPIEMPDFDLIIDCILGTGYRLPLRKGMEPWIRWINEHSAVIVSADVPSGVEANSGALDPVAVRADNTVTMGYGKLGLFLEPGKSCSGAVQVADIGFPEITEQLDGRKWNLVTEAFIQSQIKPLDPGTHKHAQGKVLLVAGSVGMTGAAYLATMGALRVGAGLTITFAPASLNTIYEIKITEGLTVPCEDHGQGHLSIANYPTIAAWFNWCDAVVIGPGLGKGDETIELVKKLIIKSPKPLVLDADGLRAVYSEAQIISSTQQPVIITPHHGELSRLTKKPAAEIRLNLIETIDEVIHGLNCILVAKNAPTCIAWGDSGYVNPTGNPGLASGGTGDVLSGMIGGLVAQGYAPEIAALLGVFLHGQTADRIAGETGMRGIIASDLLTALPAALKAYD
ncbi:MAG: NAD(P)H-hydrate dehydratase [Fidelibacterota bacterium]